MQPEPHSGRRVRIFVELRAELGPTETTAYGSEVPQKSPAASPSARSSTTERRPANCRWKKSKSRKRTRARFDMLRTGARPAEALQRVQVGREGAPRQEHGLGEVPVRRRGRGPRAPLRARGRSRARGPPPALPPRPPAPPRPPRPAPRPPRPR